MITVVGAGPGSLECLTIEAFEKIKSSEDVVSFGRIGMLVNEINPHSKTVEKVSELLEEISENTVVVASGDPNFYGIVEYLERNGVVVEKVLPGISSLQYMMGKLKKGYQDVNTISFHGRDMATELFEKGRSYFVLTDKENSPDNISRALYKAGYRGEIVLGEKLSYSDERIESKKIGDSFGNCELSVVVIEIEVD